MKNKQLKTKVILSVPDQELSFDFKTDSFLRRVQLAWYVLIGVNIKYVAKKVRVDLDLSEYVSSVKFKQ